jgi:hypothetical protein
VDDLFRRPAAEPAPSDLFTPVVPPEPAAEPDRTEPGAAGPDEVVDGDDQVDRDAPPEGPHEVDDARDEADTDDHARHDHERHDEDDTADPGDAATAAEPADDAGDTTSPPDGAGSGDAFGAGLSASGVRPVFTRPSAERLAHAPRAENHDDPDDEEPLRGTLAPVLRRSTERARYPTSTTPVIRPPVLPPTPGDPAPPVRLSRALSWQEALDGDVLPEGSRRRGLRRLSKPRHESGGVGEYRPKAAPDRSLTLLVVLAGLVAAAAWTLWPRLQGADAARDVPVVAGPRATAGP